MPSQGLERICPMAGKEEKKERVAGNVLESLHLRATNTRFTAEKAHAGKRRRNQSWRKGEHSNQDHRNSRQDLRANVGQQRPFQWQPML